MRIDPSEHQILLAEGVSNTKKNREQTVEMMFERYGFRGVNVSPQGVLALYGEGLNTGLVLDVGDQETHVVPIYEGYYE